MVALTHTKTAKQQTITGNYTHITTHYRHQYMSRGNNAPNIFDFWDIILHCDRVIETRRGNLATISNTHTEFSSISRVLSYRENSFNVFQKRL